MSAPQTLPPIPAHIETLCVLSPSAKTRTEPRRVQRTGPLVVGELLGTYLFGILTVQFYLYHLNFPNDAKWIKYLVCSIFTLDLASIVMCIADSWHWFASGYGNIIFLNDIWLSAFDTPMLGAFIAAIVQCFYCHRIWTLNKYTLPICILVSMLAVAQIIAGIYGAVVGHRARTFAAAGPKVRAATWVVNIGAAVADVLIMVTMSILLLRSRVRTNHARTDFIVRRIINLTVETNLLSSTLAVLTVILLVGVPNTNYFTAPSILLGRIYSNSLLLILNNRKYMSSDNVVSDAGTESFHTSTRKTALTFTTLAQTDDRSDGEDRYQLTESRVDGTLDDGNSNSVDIR